MEESSIESKGMSKQPIYSPLPLLSGVRFFSNLMEKTCTFYSAHYNGKAFNTLLSPSRILTVAFTAVKRKNSEKRENHLYRCYEGKEVQGNMPKNTSQSISVILE
jgi:hypothetical protein